MMKDMVQFYYRRCLVCGIEGFTMIEIMVVVVILSIMAALVVPQIGKTDSFAAQGAARVVVNDLLYAQNQAVSEQATHKVVFDVASDAYRLTDGDDVTLSAPWMGGDYELDFANDSRFPNVTLVSANFGGNVTISFDDLGVPSGGGTVELEAGGVRYRVTVTAFTGRVTVAEVTGG